MRANNFVFQQQKQNLGRTFSTSKMHLSSLRVAYAAAHSTAMVLLLLIYCYKYLPFVCGPCRGFCVWLYLYVGVLCLVIVC